MKHIEVKKLGMNTRFVFAAPKWYWSALLIALMSAFLGIPGLFILAFPAYMSVVLSHMFSRLAGVRYRIKTELFLSLFQTIMVEALYLLSLLLFSLGLISSEHLRSALLLSLALPIWLRHTYLSSIIATETRKSIPLTLSYPISSIIFLSLPLSPFPLNILAFQAKFALYILFIALSVIFSHIFLRAMDAPLKRVLDVGGLEFTRWVVEHYKERSESGKRKLEEIFRRLGEYARIDIKTVSFWRDGLSGLLTVHTAHMGPFGEVAGSDMPRKISKMLGCENFISPHGASTHEMNPVDIKEVEKIADAVKSASEGKSVQVSQSVRIDGKVRVMAQRFGGYLLVIETSYPEGTEDIDPSVARLLEEKVKSLGYEGLIFTDAHNCSSDHADETLVYSEKYPHLEKSVMAAAEKLKASPLHDAKVGFGNFTGLDIEHGIGPLGIKSVILEVEGQRTAYIVIDGNNMERALRDKILRAVEKYADNAEVMTTDNHYVNRVYGGTNPVGKKGRHGEIVKGCVSSVANAVKNAERREIRVGRREIKIKVFGHGSPVKMMVMPEFVSAMGKTLAFLNILSLVLTDLLLAILI